MSAVGQGCHAAPVVMVAHCADEHGDSAGRRISGRGADLID
jgi:hypothetical protein